MKPESLTLADGDQVELNEDGFVASVTLGRWLGEILLYQGALLVWRFQGEGTCWYHEMENWPWKDALSILQRTLSCNPSLPRVYLPHRRRNPFWRGLAGQVLSQMGKTDRPLHPWPTNRSKPSLWRYMGNLRTKVHEVVHENIMRGFTFPPICARQINI